MEYKRIEFYCGDSITDAYVRMYTYKKQNREACEGDFNGIIINSDMTEDECYMAISGKTHRQKLDEEKLG